MTLNKTQKQHTINSSFVKSISQSPGVYQMLDCNNTIIYVGKAKNLRKRISSYLRSIGDINSKTGIMLSKVSHVKTIITATEKEALILEASLIKKNKPKYNIILRDDKNYPFIKVSIKEKWPRVLISRRKINDGSKYFGPFSSASAMWETIRHVNKLFPLRRCKGKEVVEGKRACLNYQMKRCPAPCIGNISIVDYQTIVKDILMILSGNNKQLIKELTSKMDKSVSCLDYETAALYRDKINALSKTMEKQVVSASHNKNQDVFGCVRQGESLAVSVIFVRNGIINGQQTYFIAETLEDDQQNLNEIIERFYNENRIIPNEVIVPFHLSDMSLLSGWLSDKNNSKVQIKVPKRGAGLRLITMSNKNAKQVFEEREKNEISWMNFSRSICQSLHIDNVPDRIVCMDISHSSGDHTVGSVVSFIKGKKASREYRQYKINSVAGPDDYASMFEVLHRHLKRADKEDMLPDLLLVDGGKGQLNIACEVTDTLSLSGKFSLAGIAKEKEDEGDKIYIPHRKNPLALKRNSQVLLLMMRIRDEAHRFGVTFHRKLRNKKTLQSELDLIPGVGPSRKKLLLKRIGSLKRISKADINELSEVESIGSELAKKIWQHFHN